MKANEAPEKIYFTQTENGTHYYTEGVPSERNYIEYTRTDAFIEKAWDWIEDNLLSSNQEDKPRLYFEQFKNYMKGE